MTAPTFWKYLSGVMWGLYLRARLPNLKFLPLAVLELLAFKAPKFTGSRDRGHAHFSEIFVRGHVGTIPGNTPAKFEVCTFNRFGADRQTDMDRPIRNNSMGVVTWWPRPHAGHRTSDNGHHEKWQERKQSLLPMQCIGQTIKGNSIRYQCTVAI